MVEMEIQFMDLKSTWKLKYGVLQKTVYVSHNIDRYKPVNHIAYYEKCTII